MNSCLDPLHSPARVLVLDDDPCLVEMLAEMLELLGWHSTACLTAAEALDLIQQQEFDVILSDYRMPGMDGRQFYEQTARRNPELTDRIVWVTGDALSDDTRTFLKTTGNQCLSKPFRLAVLQEALNGALCRRDAACAA